MVLADRLVVLEGGRVTQEGPLAEVTARPRSRVGRRAGRRSTCSGARRDGGRLRLATARRVVAADRGRGPAFAVVHPRRSPCTAHRPEGSAPQRVAGRGRRRRPGGRPGAGPGRRRPVPIVAEVTPAAVAELRLAEGGQVWVSVKATEIDVYPADTTARAPRFLS